MRSRPTRQVWGNGPPHPFHQERRENRPVGTVDFHFGPAGESRTPGQNGSRHSGRRRRGVRPSGVSAAQPEDVAVTRDHRRMVHPGQIHSHHPVHTNTMRRKQGWLPQERYRPCPPYPGSRATGFRDAARSAPRSPDRAVPADLAPRVLPHRVCFPVNITTRRAFPEKRPRPVDNDLPPRLPAAGAGAFLTTPVRFVFDQRFTPRKFLTRFPGRDRPHAIREGDGGPAGPELSFRLRLRTAA